MDQVCDITSTISNAIKGVDNAGDDEEVLMKEEESTVTNKHDHSGNRIAVFDKASFNDGSLTTPLFTVEIEKREHGGYQDDHKKVEFVGVNVDNKKDVLSNIFISSDLYEMRFKSINDN